MLEGSNATLSHHMSLGATKRTSVGLSCALAQVWILAFLINPQCAPQRLVFLILLGSCLQGSLLSERSQPGFSILQSQCFPFRGRHSVLSPENHQHFKQKTHLNIWTLQTSLLAVSQEVLASGEAGKGEGRVKPIRKIQHYKENKAS